MNVENVKKFAKRPMTAKEETFRDKVFFWKGVPVCLTVQLAEFYGTSADVITRNFNRNKDRFKVGDHFFRLSGRQVVDFATTYNLKFNENTTVLTLWTSYGTFLHSQFLGSFLTNEDLIQFVDLDKFISFVHEKSPSNDCVVKRTIKKVVKVKDEDSEKPLKIRTLPKSQLYAVSFDSGILKVGKGFCAIKRVNAHIQNAALHGVRLVDYFIEENPQIIEEELIKFCMQNGTLCHGNEYFKDIDYSSVVNFLKGKVERKVLPNKTIKSDNIIPILPYRERRMQTV